MQKIEVKGAKISVLVSGNADYISLTDMTSLYDDGSRLIEKWLSNKNTVEFLGVWEEINNPDFNSPEFGGIRSDAGTNRFTLSVKKWLEKTHAIGLQARAGRYGGTFAHKDIAFEFGAWLSPEFKLLIIKEFQRLKEQEHQRLREGWDIKRFLSKVNYKLQTDAVKEHLLPLLKTPRNQEWLVYAEEADVINVALFGKTAKQWRDENPKMVSDGVSNMRDIATAMQLVILANLESYNSILISEGKTKETRFEKLRQMAIQQLRRLSTISSKHLEVPGYNA
jgi:hypothetical protein